MLRLLRVSTSVYAKEMAFTDSSLRTSSRLLNHTCIHLTVKIIIKWYFPPKNYIFLLTVPDFSALYLIELQSVDRKLQWETFIGSNLLRGFCAKTQTRYITLSEFSSMYNVFLVDGIRGLLGPRLFPEKWLTSVADSRSSAYSPLISGCFIWPCILLTGKIQYWKQSAGHGILLGT